MWASATLLKGQDNYSQIVMQAEVCYGHHDFIKLEALLKPLFLETEYLHKSSDPSNALIYYFKSLSVRDQQSQTLEMAKLIRKRISASKGLKPSLILDFYEASASIVLQDHEKGRRLYHNIIEHRPTLSPTLDSLVVKSYANIAVSYHMEGQWQEAKEYYLATLSLLEGDDPKQAYQETRAMVSANYLNLLFDVLKRYREAAIFLDRVMTDPFNKRINLSNHHLFMMATDYYLAVGDHRKFLDTANRLAEFYQQQTPVRKGDLGYLYLRKALYHSNMGNTTKSTLLAQQAEKLLKEEEGLFNYLPDVYEILAKNHARLNEDVATIQYINKLIDINKKEQRYAGYYPLIIAAKYYASLELDKLATCYADSGTTAYLAMPNKNEYDAETYHGEMARIHLKLKQATKAEHHLNKLTALYHSNTLFDHYKALEVETGIAYCELIKQQPRQALERLEKTRQQLAQVHQQAPALNTSTLDRGNTLRNANIFSAMAWLQISKGSQRLQELDQAWYFYQLAIKDLEDHLSNLTFDMDRISYTNNIGDYLSVGYAIALARYENNPSQESINTLLSFSQKEKSSSLQASINNRINKIKNNIDPALIKEEEQLLKENSYLMAAIKASKQNSHNDSINILLLNKQKGILNQLDALQNRIKTQYPKYKQSCLSPSTKRLTQIQQQLNDKQAILDYYFHKDECMITIIKRDSFKVCKSHWNEQDLEQLKKLIKEVNTPFLGIDQNRINNFVEGAEHCYNKLIKPVEELIEGCHLIIIPHRELFALPFEVLTHEQGENVNFKNVDYLIRRNPISYCTSLTLLPDNHSKPATVNGITAFAPDYAPAGKRPGKTGLYPEFGQLPGAQEEIARIKKHWPLKLYCEGEATKEAFTQTAPDHNIIHLAMHAWSDPAAPMQSGLVFTGPDGQYQFLRAYEIYNMHFAAPMLALNACNTGSGKYIHGEGVMSLARAFQYAGVKSIITTLWPVNDLAGISIMDFYYKNLEKQQNKHVALQQSKLKYLEEADNITAHPYFWACYTMLGDTQPLQKSHSPYPYLLIVPVLGAIFLAIRKRKAR